MIDAAALDALPLDTWIEVTNEAGAFRLVRVPGGWYLPGDLSIASADVCAGAPSSVVVLDDGEGATVCKQCESGEEAAESFDVLAEDEGLTPQQAERAARLRDEHPGPATERAIQALSDDR